MVNIILVFPKAEEAKNIRNLLTRKGFPVYAVCTTGAQVLNYAEDLTEGIVISGYRYVDMSCAELLEYLPSGFQMLVIASARFRNREASDRMIWINMPLQLHDLLDTLAMMQETVRRRRQERKNHPRKREERELRYIEGAKEVLMERNGMSEEEAHRYIQKRSMDNGTNMVETARMILSIMKV